MKYVEWDGVVEWIGIKKNYSEVRTYIFLGGPDHMFYVNDYSSLGHEVMDHLILEQNERELNYILCSCMLPNFLLSR